MASATPGYVGPYRLLNIVHTGRQSQIWQAYHDGKQQMFAIKMLATRFARERAQVGFLRWEYMVCQKVVHERIMHIHEYGFDRGTHYLAMDWFAAPNLRRRILQGIDSFGYLIPRIVDQAAEGLCYFNQSGWVHRDVKPDNFLVDDDGNVKLIDFALARRSKSGLGKALSPRSKIQGTRSYMAPEQIRGAGLDQRADVYSFGCTLYELFAGRPPYTGASADDLLRKHLRSVPPSLEAVYKNITEEFADLVRRALAKDPEKRPKSVGEFRITKIFKRDPLPPDELIRERQ